MDETFHRFFVILQAENPPFPSRKRSALPVRARASIRPMAPPRKKTTATPPAHAGGAHWMPKGRSPSTVTAWPATVTNSANGNTAIPTGTDYISERLVTPIRALFAFFARVGVDLHLNPCTFRVFRTVWRTAEPSIPGSYLAAIHSISTRAPLGRVFTATALRAGKGEAKNWA